MYLTGCILSGAGDRIRTDACDLHVTALHQLSYTRMWQFDAICQRSVYHSPKVQPTLLGAVRKDVRLSCEQSGRPLPVAEKHSIIEISTGMEVTSRGYSPSELHGAGPARLYMVNCREQ